MGLFSNKKKGCPICGEPTPRLLPTEVDGMPICKNCAKKVFLPNGALGKMSLGEFEQYLDFYDNNKVLRDRFKDTYYRTFGLFGKSIYIDEANRLFRFSSLADDMVFEGADLISFCISEDMKPLFEGDRSGLKCYESDVPDRVRSMAPMFNRVRMQKQREQAMKRMNKDDNKPDYTAPYINLDEPFKDYHVELILDHPYWYDMREKLQGPLINNTYPSVDQYLRDYDKTTEEMRELAQKLMRLIDPSAPVIRVGE
ncbi:MAG: hypothetical protein E7235_07080, partial [Lachnospiraceae bacterium]|nr:hypothetical protein [Lachnospiraceae bacterium]